MGQNPGDIGKGVRLKDDKGKKFGKIDERPLMIFPPPPCLGAPGYGWLGVGVFGALVVARFTLKNPLQLCKQFLATALVGIKTNVFNLVVSKSPIYARDNIRALYQDKESRNENETK